MQFHRRPTIKRLIPLLCAILFSVCGCSADETGVPVWEHYPIGTQFTYGIRSGTLSTLSPIVEETVGAMFLDNRHDVFVEDQICVNNTSYEIPQVLQDQEIFIRLSKYGESSIEYAVRVWVKNADYWDAYFDVHERVRSCYAAHGVAMSYPRVIVRTDS